jgi:hypothetical protein
LARIEFDLVATIHILHVRRASRLAFTDPPYGSGVKRETNILNALALAPMGVLSAGSVWAPAGGGQASVSRLDDSMALLRTPAI